MIKNIDKSHQIFDSADYQKDIVPFNLIEVLKHSPMLLTSNEQSFIIGMSAPTKPIWVWTADSIAPNELTELYEYFYASFKDKQPLHFVAKPKIAKVLAKQFINTKCNVVNMESFVCNDLIPAKDNSGYIARPIAEDIDEVAECLSGFFLDCFGETKTKEEIAQVAKNFIDKPKSFVLKFDGKIVSIACSAMETETHTAVNHVYTKPEYRGKGFAAAIVAYICKLIFESGKIPLLYADLSNPSSNKAYKNVGFVECGKVDEITMNWSEQNGI